MQLTIARPSIASLVLQLHVGGPASGQSLGTATGFLVERNQHTYLITNSHVVAGRRPDDGTITSPTGAVPDQVSIAHNQAGTLGAWVWKAEPLYEAGGDPRWRQHPAHRRQVDVIALELTDLSDVDIHGYDPWAGPGLAFRVSRPVSIIGFPFGITGGGSMGVWAQGTVATEPEMDFNNLPCFLIDSRTRPGQSGSPVIIYHSGGGAEMEDGSTAFGGRAAERFLGVYSGRISQESDLGFVWKAEAVREIVESGVPGQTS